MSAWLGRTIGNYRIEESLGVGGMGRVFRAVYVHIQIVAAIKVLHEQFAADPAFQARFLREARAAAALDHPNIVNVLDFNEVDGTFYLVMEYVPDGSLRSLLSAEADSGRLLPLDTAVDLIRQAAEALDYAHRHGMVHRDIKPDNLLLKRDPVSGRLIVKVADFGLARLGDSATLTAEGQTMGTPAYMSPEQCQGNELDGRSDLYSLGIVLFEAATGAVPFRMKSLTDAIYKHVYVAPPLPREVRPDLPEPLSAIILRCLEKHPADRFATAGELASALAGLSRAELAIEPATVVEMPGEPAQLQVVIDSGEVSLLPGAPAELTVTLVNPGTVPVRASISIEGLPDEWVSTPPRDVRLAPGAEVSGPIRVRVPAGASVTPGSYPVVVRAATSENPAVRAEATTRVVIPPSIVDEPTLAVAAVTPVSVPRVPPPGTPPPPGGQAEPPAAPRWLPVAAGLVLLLAVVGIAAALLWPDGDDDDDGGQVAGGATLTSAETASTPTAATTAAVVASDGPATETAATVENVVETPTTAVNETPTAELAAETATATVVPDEFIVFSAGRNFDDPAGSLEIYVMDPDGTNQRPLLSQPDDDWLAAISPDASRVAWASRRHGNHQLYIANIDGTGLRRLTESTGNDLHPLWSPNGRDILFVRNDDGDDELYVVNADDGSLRRLTDNDDYDGYAVWSPDSSRIAWASNITGNNEIYTLDITDETAIPQRLTAVSGNNYHPAWSPDGSQIVFASDVLGDYDIFLIQSDAAAGQAVSLTSDPADEIDPAWSPDGSLIAFCRRTGDAAEIVVLNADGSGERVLATNASPNDPDITWSPDGSRLAYLSEGDGNYDIWVATLDGNPPVRYTDAPGNDANLTWFARR